MKVLEATAMRREMGRNTVRIENIRHTVFGQRRRPNDKKKYRTEPTKEMCLSGSRLRRSKKDSLQQLN